MYRHKSRPIVLFTYTLQDKYARPPRMLCPFCLEVDGVAPAPQSGDLGKVLLRKATLPVSSAEGLHFIKLLLICGFPSVVESVILIVNVLEGGVGFLFSCWYYQERF